MTKRFIQSIIRNIPWITLTLVSLYVCYANYTPDTFLTGWDTLHPEFNFGGYWVRILNGVWQSHQGLGAVAAQAHAAEIPHVLLLELFSVVLHLNQLRYAYAFLMLILGPLGVYFFVQQLFLRENTGYGRNLGSFAAGLLYLLNLGTMQQFYVPLEMFLTHYGLLGWNLLFLSKYFESGKRKHLLLYLVCAFLIASQAHTATLFYAYFVGLLLFLIFSALVFIYKHIVPPKIVVGRLSQLVILTLLLNSFWLLPNIYFAANHGEEVGEAKITYLFSEEAFLANKKYGDIKDIALIKGYLFSWGEHVGDGHFGDLLNEWSLHLKNRTVLTLGYAFSVVALLGLCIAFIRRERYVYPLAALLLFSMFFLINDNPPFGSVFTFLQSNVPLFKEALRFPYTKFSVMYMFSFAALFGYFFGFLGKLIGDVVKRKGLILLVVFIVYISLGWALYDYMKPAFKGYMISPTMRVNIPDRYFKMFNYFEEQQEYGRVAHFPVHSFWGWVYYNWNSQTKLGYQGAGFLWFGIKQPLLDREFDRWNLLNEQYYNEVAYAVYAQNPTMLQSIFDKYNVRWVLLDESEEVIEGNPTQLFYPQIEALLNKMPDFVLDQNFGNGLRVYKNDKATYAIKEVNTTYYEAGNSYYKENYDPIYPLFHPYISTSRVVFPFIGITNTDGSVNNKYITSTAQTLTLRARADVPVYSNISQTVLRLVVDKDNINVNFKLISKYDSETVEKVVSIPLVHEPLIFEIAGQRFYVDIASLYGDIYLGDVFVKLDKKEDITIYRAGATMPVNIFSHLEVCGDTGRDAAYSMEIVGTGFVLTGRNARACTTIRIADLLPDTSNQILKINYGSSLGTPDICVLDDRTGLCTNTVLNNHASIVKVTDDINSLNLRFFANAAGYVEDKVALYDNVAFERFLPVVVDSLLLRSTASQYIPSHTTITKKFVYDTQKIATESNPYNCATGSFDFDASMIDRAISGITYTSVKQSVCDSYGFPMASHSNGYILEIRARNIAGVPLRICLTNEFSKKCDLYVSLPANPNMESYYYLVPSQDVGTGYTLNLSNFTFGNDVGKNELSYLALAPLDDVLLKGAHVNIEPTSDRTLLVYNQAYENGWVAVCGAKLCNAEHVKVDNWANGWVFKGDYNLDDVKIVFWPQLLEWVGFITLIVSLVVALVCTRNVKNFT